ncbi:MAG: hypothetical protein V2A76_00950 [Planctomycetota bacterium]
MAGVFFTVSTGPVTLSRSPQTVLQIRPPPDHRIKVWHWSLSFTGIDPTAAPVLVELIRPTAFVSATTLLTPVKVNAGDDEAWQTTCRYLHPSEPAGTTVLASFEVHPQYGVGWTAPAFGVGLMVMGGDYLSFRVSGGSGLGVNARVLYEE